MTRPVRGISAVMSRVRGRTALGSHASARRDDPGQAEQPRRASSAGPRRVPFALLVAVLISGGLVLLLALNTASAANELRRHELAQRDADVALRVQELQVRVAASAAPGNLATAAAALGMVPAGNPAFVVVGPDGTVRIMGKPRPATEPPVVVHKPKKQHHASASSSKSASASASRSASRSSSKSASKSASRSSSKSASRSTPRPTPTPVVTLPGGTR